MADGFTPPAPGSTGSGVIQRAVTTAIPATVGEKDPLTQTHLLTPVQRTRADFRNEEFTRTILQHGKRVVWRKAMLCPCVNETTGQVQVDCNHCDNSGFIYVDPIDVQVLMLRFEKSTRMYEKFGLWLSGEVQVTVEQNYRLGYRDSLEMVDELMNFNEIIKKGERRGRRSILSSGIDTARYRIINLTKALIIDKNDKVTPLEIGYHLEVNVHGQIQWRAPGKKLVVDGQIISLHYDFHPVYIVVSHPHVLRSDRRGTKVPTEMVVPLPLQVGAQLDFLANNDPNKPLPVTGDC